MSLLVAAFLFTSLICLILAFVPPNRAYRHYYLWTALALLVLAIALYLWLPLVLEGVRG